ncbi:Os01g0943700, partial [Oryza sativa Japonica Group]
WCRGGPLGFMAQYGLGPNLLLVRDPSRWHMATLCWLWKCLVVKAPSHQTCLIRTG